MKNYEPLEMTLITFAQDVVTLSDSAAAGNDNLGGDNNGGYDGLPEDWGW